MKKFISILIVGSLLTTTCVWAEMEWTPLNIAITPKISLFENPIVTGLDFGILGTQSNEVYGLQVSPFWNSTKEQIYGIQVSIINDIAKRLTGSQIGLVNNRVLMNKKSEKTNILREDIETKGMQLGAINLTNILYGTQIGFINSSKDVYGIQLAYLRPIDQLSSILDLVLGGICIVDSIHGIQIGTLTFAKQLNGLQISQFINSAENVKGIQIALIGNCVENMEGIQVCPSINWNMDGNRFSLIDYYYGLQLSCANFVDEFKGLQIGVLLNYCISAKGVQLGLVNYTSKLKGIQIGIINIAGNSSLLKVMPIINASF